MCMVYCVRMYSIFGDHSIVDKYTCDYEMATLYAQLARSTGRFISFSTAAYVPTAEQWTEYLMTDEMTV